MITPLSIVSNNAETLWNASIQKGTHFMMRTLKTYIMRNIFSSVLFSNQIFQKKTRFIHWAMKQKEFEKCFFLNGSDQESHEGIFFKRLDKTTFMILVNQLDCVKLDSKTSKEIVTEVLLVGPNHALYREAINKYVLKVQNDKVLQPYYNICDITSGYKNIISINNRSMNTIFSPQKKEITSFLDDWMNLETLYKKYELVHKTGILLYGKPGTGKTSFAKAIASYAKRDIVSIDLSLALSTIKTGISKCEGSVVLFEDVDCFIKNREENLTADQEAKLNYVLGLLDGIFSVNNCIFIATTNHIDKIDAAFKRSGRFDLIVEVTNIDYRCAAEMCAYYHVSPEILSRFTLPVNPSTLQVELLRMRARHLVKEFKTLSSKPIVFSNDIKNQIANQRVNHPTPFAMHCTSKSADL